VLLIFAVTGNAQQASTLNTYRQTYLKQEQVCLIQYEKALDVTMDDFKRKGDLDNLLILQSERKRFHEQKTVPTQADAKDAFRPATEVYVQSMVTLLGKYIKALDTLIKEETAADRIEEAKAVKVEKDMASSMLADMKAKIPVKAVAEQAAPAQDKIKGGDNIPQIVAASGNNSADLQKGRILWYSFDSDENDKITDKSSAQNDAKNNGASWTKSGRIGGGFNFTGWETLSCGTFHQPGETKEMSVSAWIYPTVDLDASTKQSVVITSHIGGTHQLYYIGGNISVEIYSVGHNVHIYSQPVPRLKKGRWHHLVFTAKTKGSLYLYVDGARFELAKLKFPIEDVTNPLSIGDRVNGIIDEVMIWDRAITDSEVKQLYKVSSP
jgi:hypothetical protein